nr:immunoglobulin light chain junction region [Macaca mulatta]MOV72424.1 immunoglobulin light chain junction region [Macaca mulatta]MOW06555.1 immunoglobulin light chain junction region [Macaca mulatta]MOW58088.1 immunoglobulin light chain junction region [Macaca mulatta]MOX46080.1 immunoglobulin light chain junction region [Macaca mulatta]
EYYCWLYYSGAWVF